MSAPILASRTDVELQASPIQPSWILEGRPSARSAELFRSEDGRAGTVVWECTEGRFKWAYDTDETIYVLEGSAIIESDIMKPTRFSRGDVVYFSKGARATWLVDDYIRKLAFLRDPNVPLLIKVKNRIMRYAQRVTGNPPPGTG
jgi:uncharacterized cupin superfamily protein